MEKNQDIRIVVTRIEIEVRRCHHDSCRVTLPDTIFEFYDCISCIENNIEIDFDIHFIDNSDEYLARKFSFLEAQGSTELSDIDERNLSIDSD